MKTQIQTLVNIKINFKNFQFHLLLLQYLWKIWVSSKFNIQDYKLTFRIQDNVKTSIQQIQMFCIQQEINLAQFNNMINFGKQRTYIRQFYNLRIKEIGIDIYDQSTLKQLQIKQAKCIIDLNKNVQNKCVKLIPIMQSQHYIHLSQS